MSDVAAMEQLGREWKQARDSQDQARQRLIPAVRTVWNDGKGLSMREIAKRLDVTLGTVQKLLS